MAEIRMTIKERFTLLGYTTSLNKNNQIHEESYSPLKTAFFKEKLTDGSLAALRPFAESQYGMAGVGQTALGTFYYVGVQTSQSPSSDQVTLEFPPGTYAVLSTAGGLSRLAFDQLEQEAFTTDTLKNLGYRYDNGPILEVLLNGDPTNAKVELWVPVVAE